MTQEEVQDEELRTAERDYGVLQSVEETACEQLAITRVRPVEQGCLKRPINRKVSRQESVEELDKELKAKIAVKRQDWSERRESLQKQDALRESESSALCSDERDESFLARGQSKGQSSPESGPLDAKPASVTLKDVLYKKLTTRVSEGIAEPAGGGGDGDGGLRSPLCSVHPDRQHSRQGKDNMKPDRLDFKAPNIEFTRKRRSFEEREDCMCRLSSGNHENLHFGSTRSKSLQLDTAMCHEHMKAGLGSVHSSPEGLAPKLFSGRGESAVEKLQLISAAESPLRKTSSDYKLEGRHVSSLKPLEGTLDIGLLSGPRISKTETCLSKLVENTSDTVSVSPPSWLQSPTERQITIPQIKSDKPKSPLAASPSPEAASRVSKEQSGNPATEVKSISNVEKTQSRPCESLKPSKGETSNFTVKQDSRTGMKTNSSLAHEHRGARHSSHFSPCGKTPSIREVSNEDQDDEVEQQEVTQQPTSQPPTSCGTAAKLEVDGTNCPLPAPVETPTAAADAPEPASVPQSCEEPTAAQNSTLTSVSAVNVENNSAPEDVQQLLNICCSETELKVSMATSASGSVHGRASCSSKSEGQNGTESSGSRDGVLTDGSAGGEKEINTGEGVEAKKGDVVNMATSSNKKKGNTVSAGAMESSSTLVQRKENPVSPKTKSKANGSETSLRDGPAEHTPHTSHVSEYCTFKTTVISEKENTTAKQKCSAPAAANENVLKSKSRTDPQPAAPHPSLKTEETKPLEGKPHSTASPGPVVKGGLNSRQRDGSNEPLSHVVLASTGVDHKESPTLVKQRETQIRNSVALKENTDSKPKSLSPKTVPSSSTPKPSVALASLIKHKDPSPKKTPAIKDRHDSKPKASHLPAAQQLSKEPLSLSNVPTQPDPKPAAKKETSSGAASGRVSQESGVKVPKDCPKSEALKADSHKGPEIRITSPDKQASSTRKEQKKKEPVQDVALAQRHVKRDARAASSALKEGSDKDSGRCKQQQKEAPRSSGSKK